MFRIRQLIWVQKSTNQNQILDKIELSSPSFYKTSARENF